MAFFKFRKGGDESAATSRQPESIEAMRRRARHRLIGAAVLVLAGVIGFPLLFDTQPRPIAVDIPIEIPDRNKVKPLAVPAQAAATAASTAPAAAVVAATPEMLPAASKSEEKQAVARAPSASGAIKIEAKPELKPEPKAVAKLEPKVETRAQPKPEPKADVKPAPKPDDGAKARALLEGKSMDEPASAAAQGRFVVQVGAFADDAKARETRLKVEKAGMKTYTHVAETREGKRTRVRVGPFATRAEADKAAEKIKGLELPATILTL